jgi:uncharacterized repeat protein (TIGR03803 family)
MVRILHLIGTCVAGCLLAMFVPHGAAQAKSSETVLYAFQGGSDGAEPFSGLVADKAANLYGTTEYGGGTGCYSDGCGTVFRIAPDGTETVLHAFQGGSDGEYPLAGVILDKAGNLYGTTSEGGGTGCEYSLGCGTVFRVAPNGTETVLYAFQGGNDGDDPQAGLLADNAGNLYGTTYEGGITDCTYGCGTVFKVAPDGSETVLYSFCAQQNCADGDSPSGALIADKAGNLYGTAGEGGTTDSGTVFRLAPDGTLTTLYSFCAKRKCADGDWPAAALLADRKGNLYGTTSLGGARCEGDGGGGCGAVFKLAPDGKETVLYSFDGRNGDDPLGNLIADKSGNLYSTTLYGKENCVSGCGLVFEVAPDGTETPLHNFSGGSDGAEPLAGLIADGQGNFYGTTSAGGGTGCGYLYQSGCGTVFKLTP